jgi:glycosyltransferase involved in cell wall biosynthesis
MNSPGRRWRESISSFSTPFWPASAIDFLLMSEQMRIPRLAVLCDYPEEGWPSMDLSAEMLLAGLSSTRREGSAVEAVRVCPPFRRLLGVGGARNVDRLVNRLWHYPRYVRREVAGSFDFYHIVDHSYSQLVHALPADRTGVFCHDLDTFRCILEPDRERRPRWFRAMARHILRGMQKASLVFYTTETVRQQILRHQLIEPARLVQAPLGVSLEFHPSNVASEAADRSLAAVPDGTAYLLHVGSCIARKRIDVLLEVFARLRRDRPGLKLVKVGGEFDASQQQQIRRMGIEPDLIHLRDVSRERLAALYRAAAVVLQPSEAEGFGLPIIEALACGAIVVASDIPALREVGGGAVVYCRVGEIDDWMTTTERIIADAKAAPSADVRRTRAARYSWDAHAATLLGAYRSLCGTRTS